MMTPWYGNAFRITVPYEWNLLMIGGFPYEKPVMQYFGIFCDVSQNKLLNKQVDCR